jgi:MFS family permease
MPQKRLSFLLAIIVFAQFTGTSLWFAANAVVDEILLGNSITGSSANITAIVQFGFIAGTLVFSLLTIADRFPASKVFLVSSIIGAVSNILLLWLCDSIVNLFVLRFITGFFLAGIYPVGMKIAADFYPKGLGNALGFLVGALVLGTAFPHLVRSQLAGFDWRVVITVTSILATVGGFLIYLLVPSAGRHHQSKLNWKVGFHAFRERQLRSAAFGYFGHMWELYTFWAFVPVLLLFFNELSGHNLSVSLWSFIIIGIGSLGCVAGGIISKREGSKPVAFYALLISGICSLLSMFMFHSGVAVFITFMIVWGITVVTDSPQFSSMVAQSALVQNRGTALTLVTSIGFTITIVSVQLMKLLFERFHEKGLIVLAIGPALGLFALRSFSNPKANH